MGASGVTPESPATAGDRRGLVPATVIGLLMLVAYAAPSTTGIVGRLFGSGALSNLPTLIGTISLAGFGILFVASIFTLLTGMQSVGRAASATGLFLPLLSANVILGVIIGLTEGYPVRYVLGNVQYFVVYFIILFLAPALSDRAAVRVFRLTLAGFTIPAIWNIATIARLIISGQLGSIARIIQDGTAYSCVASVLWLAFFLNRHKPIYFIVFLLCAGPAFTSGTRSTILGWLAGTIVLLALHSRGRWRTWAFTGAVGAVILLMVSPQLLTLQSSITGRDATALAHSTSVREQESEVLLDVWRSSPVLGAGYGEVPPLTRRTAAADISRPYIVELSYQNMLAKTGLVGAALYVLAFATLLYRLSRTLASVPSTRRTVLAALMGGVACLLVAAGGNPLLESVYMHTFVALTIFVWCRPGAAWTDSLTRDKFAGSVENPVKSNSASTKKGPV